MNLTWTEDEDGDFQLEVDGEYFGLVCIHHLPEYVLCVWDFAQNQAVAGTVEEAKAILERAARKQAFLKEQADKFDLQEEVT